MGILKTETMRRHYVDADPTITAIPGVALPGDTVSYAGTNYVVTASGVVPESSMDESPVFTGAVTAGAPGAVALNLGGAAAAATTVSTLVKVVGSIADNTGTPVLTVTIPNAAHSASLRVRLVGTLGAGGAIGAREATGTVSYDIGICRTAGVAVVAVASSAYGSGMSNVAGAATITVVAAVSAIAGEVTAANTFTVDVTINSGSGSSANHTCMVVAELANAVASGVTMA